MPEGTWNCPKCGNGGYETSEIRTSGGALSGIFDVDNRKFSTVTCDRCSCTEIYRTEASGLGKVFDFFTT